MSSIWALLILTVISYAPVCLPVKDRSYASEVVYEWTSLDYKWPNDTVKNEYIASGNFVKRNNVIAGIKVYKDDVYVTVPRWRDGVPSTLNKVVVQNGNPILQPFPNWAWQTLGDCEALQYVQSMEVDPNKDWMWIIDVGRINIFPAQGSPQNLCLAKIIVYDMKHNRVVKKYVFPASVVSPTTNFLNDIVLDYVNGEPCYAYITDASSDDPGLVVYDFQNNMSHRFKHIPSMTTHIDAENITISNVTYTLKVPIDGIALSPDSRYLYFCPLSDYSLYQVSTEVVRNPFADFGAAVRKVGKKVSQTGGMAYGQNNLYFGALSLNGVFKWEISEDAKEKQTYDKIEMKTQSAVVLDNVGMQWVDTFGFDERGYLWFITNRLQHFFQGTMDFSDTLTSANMRIWKVYVGEQGYMGRGISRGNSIVCNSMMLILTVVGLTTVPL